MIGMLRARREVITDHARGLHKGITNRWTDKTEAFLFETLAQLLRNHRLTWDFGETGKMIDLRLMINK